MTKRTILINGKTNARVVERLTEHFDLVDLPAGGTVSPEMAAKISGLANFGLVPAGMMDQLPHLEIIANFGVGYDGVDALAAGSRNIIVTNTPDVLNDEVADTTIGLLLNTIRQFPAAEAYLRAGRWVSEGAFPLTPLSLQGRHAGIYGLGRIGIEIARRLEAFGLKISYHSRNPRPDAPYRYFSSLAGLAEAVDTLICIVPKTPETHKVINAEILATLGNNGVLINIGRGWTVDEDALAAALSAGVIAAAGLDVFQDEPHVPQALLDLPNLTLLPHVGSASVRTRTAMADLVADNLISWFSARRPLTPVAETPWSHPG